MVEKREVILGGESIELRGFDRWRVQELDNGAMTVISHDSEEFRIVIDALSLQGNQNSLLIYTTEVDGGHKVLVDKMVHISISWELTKETVEQEMEKYERRIW